MRLAIKAIFLHHTEAKNSFCIILKLKRHKRDCSLASRAYGSKARHFYVECPKHYWITGEDFLILPMKLFNYCIQRQIKCCNLLEQVQPLPNTHCSALKTITSRSCDLCITLLITFIDKQLFMLVDIKFGN